MADFGQYANDFYNPEVENLRMQGPGVPGNPAGAAMTGNPYTASGNELMINGEKRKMTVGDVGQNGTGWYQWGSNDGPAAGGGASSFSIGGGPAPTNPGGYDQNTDKLNSVWSQLAKQAGQGTKIDTNDPAFRQTADRYAAQVERSRRNSIADNAEKMSAQRLGGSGAQAVASRMATEKAGQDQGMFEANLAQRELANRRAEIQSALTQMAGMGDKEQQRKLTQELAYLDAQMRASGLQSNERIAGNQLGFNYSNLEANQNNTALRAAMGLNF